MIRCEWAERRRESRKLNQPHQSLTPSSIKMATLADELLADFGSDDEGEQQQEDQPQDGAHGNPSSKRKASDPDYDDDLDDLMGDADEEVDGGHNDQEMGEGDEQEQKDLKLGKNAVKPTEEMDQDQVEQMDLKKEKSVKNVSKLMNSSKMKEVMVVSTQSWKEKRGGQDRVYLEAQQPSW